jgi:transposase-like protein
MRSKHKRYSAEFKNKIIKEVKETGNASLVARKHDLVAGTVTRWVRDSKKNNSATNSDKYNINKDDSDLVKENDRLKKLLGEKDLELAILRDLLKKTNQQ